MNSRTLTLQQVANRLSLSLRSIQRLVADDRIRTVVIDRRRHVRLEDLEHFIDSLPSGGRQ